MIKVLFFARLRERLGSDGVEVNDCADLSALKQQLLADHPEWASELDRPNILVAINQDLVNSNVQLKAGDEVAFFPPVTGG